MNLKKSRIPNIGLKFACLLNSTMDLWWQCSGGLLTQRAVDVRDPVFSVRQRDRQTGSQVQLFSPTCQNKLIDWTGLMFFRDRHVFAKLEQPAVDISWWSSYLM